MADGSGSEASWLFVLPWEIHHPGGVNQVVENLCREMREKGPYSPILFIIDWQFPRARCATIAGRLTYHSRLRPPWVGQAPVKGLTRFLLGLPRSILRCRKIIIGNRIQVVNIHYPTLESFVFLIMRWSRLFRGKVILSLHGTDLANASGSRGAERRLWSFMFAAADHVVTCSLDQGQKFRACFPRCASKHVTIHNGVDYGSLVRDRDVAFELDRRLMSTRYVLSIGNFVPAKGHDILVHAFAEVARSDQGVHLVIVGGAGPTRPEVERLIQTLGLADRISLFTDVSHDRVAAFLQQACMFVLPSRSESLPLVLLEAAAFSLAVVASNVGGIPEIVEQGVSGRLVQPEDVTQLSGEIVRLLQFKEECVRLGAALHSSVLRKFRWAEAYRQYVQLVH